MRAILLLLVATATPIATVDETCPGSPVGVVDHGPRTCAEIFEAFQDSKEALAPILPSKGAAQEIFWRKIVLRVRSVRSWQTQFGSTLGLTTSSGSPPMAYYVQVGRDLTSVCHEMGHVVLTEKAGTMTGQDKHPGWSDAPFGVDYLCKPVEAKWWARESR